MSPPTINETRLARLFLVAVMGLGLMTRCAGVAPGEIHLVPCPVYTVTGIECPGCGMTRACAAISQGQLDQAWQYHPLAFVLLTLAISFAVAPGAVRIKWQRLPGWSRVVVLASLYLAALGLWISRLVT